MRVLHVLHHSLPQLSGYSIRTNYILKYQKRLGIDARVVTSAQQEAGEDLASTVEGIRYVRTRALVPHRAPWREVALMRALASTVHAQVREFAPHVIHAHSPVLVGLPARATCFCPSYRG